MDASLLSPDPECLDPSAPIASSGHEMAPWPEVTVDHRVRREEPLRLSWRFEALHLLLSSSGGSMRILGSIVQIPALSDAGPPGGALAERRHSCADHQ